MIWGRGNTPVLIRRKTMLTHQIPSPANLPLHDNSSYYEHNKKRKSTSFTFSPLLEAVTGPKTKVSFLSAKQEFYGSYLKIPRTSKWNTHIPFSEQVILETYWDQNHTPFTLTCYLWGPYFLFFIRISAWAIWTPHILSYLFILLGGTSLLYSGEKTEEFCPITWANVVFHYLLSARL